MKKIIILLSIILSSCSINQDYKESSNKKIVRQISYEELSKFSYIGYNILYDNIIFKDLNGDGYSNTLLILQDKNSDIWVGGLDDIKPIILLVLEYNFLNDNWNLINQFESSGTLFKSIEFYEINGNKNIYLKSKKYGVSDGSEILNILNLEGREYKEYGEYYTSISNGGDILIKNNGEEIIVIDKIFGEGESRGGCHKFSIEIFKYNVTNNKYEISKNIITSNKYNISYEEIDNYNLKEIFEDGCYLIGGNKSYVQNNKIDRILKDLNLNNN